MVKATMASSQVELATTSAPFGCAATVHNHRDSSCFRNDLNNLVSSSCIPNDHNNTSNNSARIDFTDLWVHHPQWQTTATTTTTNNKKKKKMSNNNDDNDNNRTKKDHKSSNVDNHNNNNNNNNHNNRTEKDHDSSNIDGPPHNHRNESKWGRAREMVFSGSASAKGSSSCCDSGSVEVTHLGGVSSLVQKWRGFEAEAKCSARNNSSASSSTATPRHDASAVTNDQEDPFGDWESDRTAVSGPPSSRGRESDAAERERLRVADIIRKLSEENRSSDTGGPDSSPRGGRMSLDHQSEPRCLSPLIGSPRIRGRQAFHDLLIQMQRERRKELEGLNGCKAVSKFPHRGRIQAVLRIRLLRRGIEPAESRHSNSTLSESHKATQFDAAYFRERVGPSLANGSVHTGSYQTDDSTSSLPNLCVANQQRRERQYGEVVNSKGHLGIGEHHILESEGSATWDSGSNSLVESVETGRISHYTDIKSEETGEPLCSIKIKIPDQEREVVDEQVVKSSSDLIHDCHHPQSYQEGKSPSNQESVETPKYWVSDVSHPEVGWEELHSEYQLQDRCNRGWIDEVSRPRSDWEGLRKARYQEMFDLFSDNEEIQMLLGRRSVSTFLSSGLREKIDQVMIARVQEQKTLKSKRTQEEKHEKSFPKRELAVVTEKGEGIDGVDGQEDEEDYGGYIDEFEEAESSVGQQCNESDDCMDYITSSPSASWAQNQGRESTDCSYQAPSPSTQQSLSNFCSHNNGSNPLYGAHPGIDMELIYDLRKQMEQLHQEMSELRRSIKCCMEMQIKQQRSIEKEVMIALNLSDAKNGQHNSAKVIKDEGKCRVCCKMQVDSLLYRCGHMCTCYECAHELQFSCRKCPICAAPIHDVIRAYSSNQS